MVHIPPVGRGTIWGIKRPKLNFCPVSAIPTSREFSSVNRVGESVISRLPDLSGVARGHKMGWK